MYLGNRCLVPHWSPLKSVTERLIWSKDPVVFLPHVQYGLLICKWLPRCSGGGYLIQATSTCGRKQWWNLTLWQVGHIECRSRWHQIVPGMKCQELVIRHLPLKTGIHGGVSFSCRSTGMPSPHSPVPSPARSVSSQQGSNGSNCGCNGVGSSVTIPSITSSYVNITSYVLYAYNIWEHADALSKNNKGKVPSL